MFALKIVPLFYFHNVQCSKKLLFTVNMCCFDWIEFLWYHLMHSPSNWLYQTSKVNIDLPASTGRLSSALFNELHGLVLLNFCYTNVFFFFDVESNTQTTVGLVSAVLKLMRLHFMLTLFSLCCINIISCGPRDLSLEVSEDVLVNVWRVHK